MDARMWLLASAVLTVLIAVSYSQDVSPLEWIPMGENQEILPPGDDAATEVNTPIGFNFGGSIHHDIYVSTNGLISFDVPLTTFFNIPFPGFVTNLFVIAPFWDDANTNDGGTISYEIHTSGDSLQLVSSYIRNETNSNFEGYWMMVVLWDQVPPYSFFTTTDQVNTFQAILITDSQQNTYAIFIYECGLMEWDNFATIGYNAGPDNYDNHHPSSSDVACVNVPNSNFSNVFYQLHEAEPLPTVPAQNTYLDFLSHTTTTISSGYLQGCDECSSPEISLQGNLPFGNYYHQSAYVTSNGHISFQTDYTHFNSEPFPTSNPGIYWDFVAAPFWSDVDMRLEGSASWEVHTTDQSEDLINHVSVFIQENYEGAENFTGYWMMITYWEDVHPFPHGFGFFTPYTLSTNTFQAILITDGTKSYAVYTYRCGEMEWGDESSIGFNAGADYYENHVLTGHFQSHYIACLQNTSAGSNITNQIYDLVPNPSALLSGTIPPIHNTIGSCADAGFTDCCTEGDCRGLPLIGDCFCDGLCETRGDCCYDQQHICPTGLLTDDYLIVADDSTILHMSLNGTDIETLYSDINGRAYGIDYHLANGLMVWSDVERNKIYKKNLNGTGLVTELVTTNIAAVDDVAIDWIGNNLYWTDAVWARIEVMDLGTGDRAEVLRTGANTNPRAIAVDPSTRLMYWTELGEDVKIEKASMDGSSRTVLFGFGLIQPNGLTIDISEQRLYWCDTVLNTIVYVDIGPSGGVQDFTQLTLQDATIIQPFSVSLSETSVFWTDWSTNSISATHKVHGTDTGGHLFTVYTSQETPRGLEVVSSSQQPTDITNTCDGSGCSHICMLSTSPTGFTCACPENYELGSNGLDCEEVSTPSPTAPLEGSCVDAGYTDCCTHGSCGGSPATCFCDEECYGRFDCCSDIVSICNEVPPVPAQDIDVTFEITSATISFTIPFVVYESEQYMINYGLSAALGMSSPTVTSQSGGSMQYQILISDLLPGTTYYFQLSATNTISTTLSGLFSGTTLEDAPSGPPQNFNISVDGTTLTVSWEPPLLEERNGVIISYTLACDAGGESFELRLNPTLETVLYELSPLTQYTCEIAASTSAGLGPAVTLAATTSESENEQPILRWLPMGSLYGVNQEFLPVSLDGFVGPIDISTGFPFGSSVQTQVFVGTNGLLSYGTGYNSFVNQAFPGNALIQSRFLVAPFWDDVDIRFNTGDISYEIHESGYFLDQVNAYIRQTRPTDFVGTWMMVVFYDAVHPFFGLFNSQENTFQAIVITDGTYSYTIFTYQCGFMEWDNGANIGFNAASEMFANHDPSTSEVACINFPATVWSNVIFRLSANSSESPPPSNVEAVNITLNHATIRWNVTSVGEEQQYTVLYGTDPSDLGNSSGPILSSENPALMFRVDLNGLSQGTTYYVQVVAEFDVYTITSDVISFTTLEPAIESAPLDFTAVALGTSVTFTWIDPIVDVVVVSYQILCNNGELDIEVKAINEITLYDLAPETIYFCSLSAASSGGYGPASEVINVTTGDAIEADMYFSFIPMDIHLNFEQLFFPGTDDGYAGPFEIPGGLPFGDSVQTDVYIGSNGILSFGSPYNPFLNQELPVPDVVLVAPYWDDIDTRFGSGQISIEFHDSGYFLEEVSEFIRRRRSALSFTGTWMLIVYWDAVHPYFGFFNPEENTFQAILITDGTYSYSLFTYNCALMEWDNGVTIGISDGGDFFHTFNPSTSEVACLNLPHSNFSNVIYRLSAANPEIPPPGGVTITDISMTEATISWNIPSFTVQEEYIVEYGLSADNLDLVSDTVQSISDNTINYQPYNVTLQGLMGSTQYYFRVLAEFGVGNVYHRSTNVFSFFTQFEPQSNYLQMLPHTGTSVDSGILLTCDDCSSLEITFPSDFPLGGYYHQSAFVSTNGIISFGTFLLESEPEAFPPTDPDTFWTYIVAPFWADFDTTMGGTISWEIHDNTNSPALVGMVDTFIQDEFGDQTYEGSWMLVAFWENVQPSGQTEGNTFQAILTTNGTKSYAVFTYQCGSLDWTDAATIGYYAPTTAAFTHPLSTAGAGALIRTDEIACLHAASNLSNLIFELEVSNHILEMTPEPNFATGSCVEAGFTECCQGFQCAVESCFCDSFCHFFGDCCYDINEICPAGDGSVYDILVGHGHHISQIHFEGSSSETVRTNTSGTVVGVDYLYLESLMFWSDVTTDTIHLANLDGSDEIVLVDSCISIVEDIAVDWVSYKLYWTDSSWARIEALDLNTSVRVEVLATGANTVPRAIAVDPVNRVMFWTDYGLTAKIETAAMDGSERRTLHFSGLSQPNGITIDYLSGRIYWSDAGQDRLEYSNFDGSDRNVVESGTTGLVHPFAVTVADGILFWSDWATNKIYATHYEHGALEEEGYFAEIVTFLDTPYGIEALREDRQPQAMNPCLASGCSHMCLLTFTNDAGYSCACPEGYDFENETFCRREEGPPTSCTITPGSCAAYSSCCEEGFCGGSPATCFCDEDCRLRGDCCSDINDTCIEGWPRQPRDISTEISGQNATITWLIPFIESTPETYIVQYGISVDDLDFVTNRILSGDNTSIVEQQYSVTIEGLSYITTYYFRIRVTNDVGTASSDVLSFLTGEGVPSAPPTNVSASVKDTFVCLSWGPPPEDQQNGFIISYLPTCISSDDTFSQLVKGNVNSFCVDIFEGGEEVTCSVLASTAIDDGPSSEAVTVTTEGAFRGTLQFIALNATFGVDPVLIPESDDGTFGPITLPDYGFPFWSSNRMQAYVAVNGLLSFNQPYGSFFNQPFPGSFFISTRYLVAPFWDDANINGGRGRIYYEVHESGYLLEQVSTYLQLQRPSEFQGTWMLVVHYDAVQPFGFNPTLAENTYQAILITDGTYTYTIFTYDCNLMEWGTSATIGFNAGGEEFVNNEYTSNAIACSNLPTSNITNVIYRLSQDNGEYALPSDIIVTDVQQTTVTVCWTVPSVTEQQEYTVVYGLDPSQLDQMSEVVTGEEDLSLIDEQYCVALSGLQNSALYHFKITITFGGVTVMTELSTFRTLDDPPSGPPTNVQVSVMGVSAILVWESPDVGTGVLLSYNLSCSVEDVEVLRAVLKPIQGFTLEELNPATIYTCSVSGATSGGEGPSAAITFSTEDITTSGFNLPYVMMDTLLGVQETAFPASDEGVNGPLPLDIGFPFGTSSQTQVYVGTNGILSFGSPYGSYLNQPFPGSFTISSRYLVAPFWDDVDTRNGNGQVSYEVHQSGYYLDSVNLFLRRNRPSSFEGTWMMVVHWDAVHAYPWFFFSPQENTFQAILITDGVYSYTIFVYQCGLMDWGTSATIGYNAAGEHYANNDPSSFAVACVNQPYSDYSNVIYLLSNESPEIPTPQDVVVNDITTNSAIVSWRIPSFIVQEEYYVAYGTDPDNLDQRTASILSPEITIFNATYSTTLNGLQSGRVYYIRVFAVYDEVIERYTESIFPTRDPEQGQYFTFLSLASTSTTLDSCDDCTSGEITFPSDFPFGGYFHQSAYVSTNGLISFGRPITNSDPVLFPSTTAIIAESYILAPFWADFFTTTTGGSVSWWVEEASDSISVGFVSNFIRNEYGVDDFSATWMLVAYWQDLQPGNTFQAILLTDGTKSYAVFTYRCEYLQWSGSATIGVNTPDDIRINHPLSGTPLVDNIACVHLESEWNNVIYELETNPVILPVTPEPSQFLGSCVAAGYTDCCNPFVFSCLGAPNFDCYCDTSCVFFGDCCSDFGDICGAEGGFDVLVGHGHHISQVHFEGEATETIRTNTTGTVVGVDYLHLQSKIFWSDVTTDTIHRANMDGTEEEVVASTSLIAVDDIAVDWVSGKLYWTDAGWARIEVMDLESLIRVELVRTGTNTIPRAIAVDPERRVMYWSDWGRTAKIEMASMDGAERRDFVITDLSQPNGISIDLVSERVYWSDADLDKLEFISFGGDGRTTVETEATGLGHPFSVSVGEDILFWSDWATNSIYATHKEHGANDGNGYFATIASFPSTPYGVEALVAERQPSVENPCENNECSHICLLSEVATQQFVCACPLGYLLDNDTFCKVSGDTVTPTPPPPGNCSAAGYEYCCEHGFCAGYPATCFCDSDCSQREDCCSDISSTCVPGTPRAPIDVSVSNIMQTSALIRWTIPFIVSSQESYFIIYGFAPDALIIQSAPLFSGANVTSAYSQLLTALDPAETYYFRVIASNAVGQSGSDINNFMTPSGPPTGPPLDFMVEVDRTAMAFTWSPPNPMLQNGEINNYTLSCVANTRVTSVTTTQLRFTMDTFIPGEAFQCSVYATNQFGDGPTNYLTVTTPNVVAGTPAYLALLSPGENEIPLPGSDDGVFGPIALPESGFPFWNTNRLVVYVGTNGILSFDSPYGSFSNRPFPSFLTGRYLVAPFWDDADTRFGNGQVSYEVYESGYALDYVSAFIRRTYPSDFRGTWMMISFWDAVRPYHSLSSTTENTYQAILITDGNFAYTVFTYDCNLHEWGSSATIGFMAGEDVFENNEFTTNAIACSSLPDSNVTNVVYRLSSANPEYPPPQNVQVSDITLTTATISWVVPYTHIWQQYSLIYGVQPDILDQSWGLLYSSTDLTQLNQEFSITVLGLTQGTDYYLRVSSTFDYSVIYSELVPFLTLEPPPTGPPLNFSINVIGTTLEISWQQPAEELRMGLIRYYTLLCTSQTETVTLELYSVLGIALDDFKIDTNYVCTISASTSGGPGPTSTAFATTEDDVEDIYLPLIPVGDVRTTETVELPESDDGVSDAITIPPFPFGNSVQTTVFVGTNGILSFNSSYNTFFNSPFSESLPLFRDGYLVAPFWDDVDIRGGNGRILYEIHESGYFLNQVNRFLQRRRPSSFEGTWMLVAHWDEVHPYFGAGSTTENTFQAILITDGNYSYTIFTYKCGLMEWDNGATIGFKATGDFYENYDPSSSAVACLNSPESEYSNVIFLLSSESPEIPIPDMVTASPTTNSATVTWRIPSFTTEEEYYILYGTDPDSLDLRTDRSPSTGDTTLTNIAYTGTLTGLDQGTIYYLRIVAVFDVLFKRQSEVFPFRTLEDEQAYYLEFLEHSSSAEVVDSCADGCTSSEIVLPYDFPFSGYFHQTAFVGTNGIITFGAAIGDANPEQFPLSFWSYLVAPLWVNINTTRGGAVQWEIFDNSNHSELLDMVEELIHQEQGDDGFDSLWMLVATWKDVQFTDQLDDASNTFQAVLITNRTKSYSIFTFNCDEIQWSGSSAIGFNAPPATFYNEPITSSPLPIETLACSHDESVWNNIIIDLQPGNVILPTTPQPSLQGSCRDAGYSECCAFSATESCIGTPVGFPPCFCDTLCVFFSDCCFDADHTCNAPTYDLLVGNGDHLSLIHFEGTVSETVRSTSDGNVVGVDFHAARSVMFWSDTEMRTIHQANLDGQNDTVLVNTDIRAVDDIAVDWIANNLYWVDSVWARIEALNLDSLERADIVRVGANTRPRAIAVDPITTFMFWTDWGQTAKIERAFMDGKERRTIHEAGLSQPNGITIDYVTQRIYWSDSDLDKLEYSNYDGTQRMLLETEGDGLLHPFALTIADDILFWTDWETNYLYFTHKDHGNTGGLGVFQSLAHFTSTPYGVEAISAERQMAGNNTCADNECSHICLLSASSEAGFVCACAVGSDIQNDDRSCSTPSTPPEEGSCVAAGYSSCCSHGFCAGIPATCSCNPDCHDLGDCCSDIDDVCPAVQPLAPSEGELIHLTRSTAVIQWTVPTIVFSPEIYTFMYSTTQDTLNTMMIEPLFSGTDISQTNKAYTVTLENLSPGTTYYYQIEAENTLGITLSDIFSFETPYVGAPQNFTITVEGSETLTFSWDLPLDIEPGLINYFLVSCEPTFQHAISAIVLGGLSVTLEEFLPGTTYTCTVQAKSDELGAPAVQTATTEEAPTNLPFLVLGATEGVEKITLPPSDDATSAPIYIMGGLPLGNVTQTIAHVGTNGIVSFGQDFMFWNPELFPTANYYIHNSYVAAPFWADIDTRLEGSVFYETHQRGANEGSNAVLERLSGFISSEMSVNFTGSWMLVAQWDRVHPFPHGFGQAASEQYGNFLASENTFQTVIVTDGAQSFAMFTYQCDLMAWSGEGFGSYATIGYNLNGAFENHPLSGTAEVQNIGCVSNNNGVSRRQASNWHNQLYQLPTVVDPQQQLRSECLTMQILDTETVGDIQSLSSSLGACPPSASQAFIDFRFVYHSESSTLSSRCYVHFFSAGEDAVSSLICCYAVQSSVFGALLVGGLQGSSIALYHPIHFADEHATYDKEFREKCCSSGLCDVFHARRPIDSSINYIPPFFGFGNGDPHITTLDGTTYTFNGRGEYTLVEILSTGFALQGRTEPVSETSNATQFSAFAMGIKAQYLSAEIRLYRGRLIAFINGQDISSAIEEVNETTVGNNSALYLTRTGPNEIRMLLYRDSLAYVFTVTQRGDILDFVINLEESVRGDTRGLFGNFNGESTDDFIRPNGIVVPSNASDEMLHEYGQSWQITEQKSLFTYPSGMSHSSFTFPDHIPPLLSDVVASAPDDIVDMCGGNEQCIFDAVQTNNPDIGAGTLTSITNNNNDVMIANNFPPTVDGPATFRVNIGQPSVYTFTAIDDDAVEVTVEGPEGYSLTLNGNSYTFSWTASQVFVHSIVFVAVDSMGVASTLSPRVEICACQNGNCTLDGILTTDLLTINMLCECTPGWEGRYCEDDQDGCSALTCFEGVQCYDVAAPASGAICGSCPLGFQGDGEKCADIDECNSTSTDCEQICINTPGNYMCGCRDGYELTSATNCDDIDECQLQFHDCEQECTNSDGSFTCSCREGYELDDDGRTCKAIESCEDNSLSCEEECVVIDGNPTCTCPNGFELASNGQSCQNINECEDAVQACEDKCMDTEGSFVCECSNDHYTLSSNQRTCIDINECVVSALSGISACPKGEVCTNMDGGYDCECPSGTMRNSSNICEEVEITQPPVVTIPTNPPVTDPDGTGRKNSVNVTLRISKEEFDVNAQFKFKIDIVYAVKEYCAENTGECGVDQVFIDPSDVIILDEIVNDANGRATFLMFVYIKTDVLSGKILQISAASLDVVATVEPVIDEIEGGGSSGGGLSGGGIAGIVILLIVVMVVVLIVAIIIYHMQKSGPKIKMISNLTSGDVFRNRPGRSSMLIEEGAYDVESMKETVSVGGDIAEAKAKEAAMETEEGQEPPGEETKVDMAEETV